MKAILTYGVLLFSNALFSQSSYLEGRGATGQGLWSENTAGVSRISYTSFGVRAMNRFGLLELSRTQFKIAKPTKFGVIQVHWHGFGDQLYSQSDWGLSFARALSPDFFMGMTGRYKVEQIANDKQKALLLDIGMQYVITSKLSAATFLINPLRVSLEPSAFHMGLQYQFSPKVSFAVSAHKKEALPLSLDLHLKYFPTASIGLQSIVSTQSSNHTFGIVFLSNAWAIDAHLSYHYYLGISPQMALTYQFE